MQQQENERLTESRRSSFLFSLLRLLWLSRSRLFLLLVPSEPANPQSKALSFGIP